ncbi:MAG: plasmid stabilization protein [Hyphomicrobiales bacterium]|nr:MAG: plasmid stabilization protein [Hyphomicrobiales bacterium]
MRVFVTDAAWDDMLDIVRTVARDNPQRADTFLDELYDACRDIGRFPLASPPLPDRPAAGIRRKVHGNYLIFYRLQAGTVEILRLVHGARDYERLLFPEG